MEQLASGVVYMPVTIANVYFIGKAGQPWVVIDTGTPRMAGKVRAAAEEYFGAGSRPSAILLTHGHFDHSGSAFDLANEWDVPIFAHPLETPYITGQTSYPPPDPTVGGAFAFMTRFFPPNRQDLRPRLQEMPANGSVPFLDEWQWIPTPGHSPGHISFYREKDRTLLAGDAFTTVDMSSLTALAAKKQTVSGPPDAVTCDWGAARESVKRLAALSPAAIGCGHGIPMEGPNAAQELDALAADFPVPAHGRYAAEPAITDEQGIVSLPPPAPDPLPKQLIAGAAALGFISLGRAFLKRRQQ